MSLDNLQGAWQKIGRRVFLRGVDTSIHIMTCFWYMSELKIGLADMSALDFDQSSLQFNGKKKINAKKSS